MKLRNNKNELNLENTTKINDISGNLIHLLCHQMKNSPKMVDLLSREKRKNLASNKHWRNVIDHLIGLGFSRDESLQICKNFANLKS